MAMGIWSYGLLRYTNRDQRVSNESNIRVTTRTPKTAEQAKKANRIRTLTMYKLTS